ncbi:MAG TPA: hypothetical protein VGF39_04080 [Stellaceae bacterium]
MKGINLLSHIKHDLLKELAGIQVAIAFIFLRPGDRVLIVDMHAGDAAGAQARQRDFWRGEESRATPFVAIDAAARFARRKIVCDLVLFEKSPEARRALIKRLTEEGHAAHVGGNHKALLNWPVRFADYAYALVLNDPNGPKDHGDEVLARIAREAPKADFLIVVNESACSRVNGVTGNSTDPEAPRWARSGPEAAEAVKRRHRWRLDPLEWARRLDRSYVLQSKVTVGTKAMQGRILLVTNFIPERPPANFIRHAISPGMARGGSPQSASRQSAARRAHRRHRGDSSGPGLGV